MPIAHQQFRRIICRWVSWSKFRGDDKKLCDRAVCAKRTKVCLPQCIIRDLLSPGKRHRYGYTATIWVRPSHRRFKRSNPKHFRKLATLVFYPEPSTGIGHCDVWGINHDGAGLAASVIHDPCFDRAFDVESLKTTRKLPKFRHGRHGIRRRAPTPD